jgi:hypothetical protein
MLQWHWAMTHSGKKLNNLLIMPDITPEQSAKELIEMKFSVERYEQLQFRRKERLKYWQEHGVQVLIEKETELVEYGEKVLSLMKKVYERND